MSSVLKGLAPFVLATLTACTTTVPRIEDLVQASPREVSPNLKLTADASLGPVIPGLAQGAVPQGLAWTPGGALVLTSHYFDDGRPSSLVVLDWDTGIAGGTFTLLEPDGERHRGHVGGIATDATSVWIASDAWLYRGDLNGIVARPSQSTSVRTLEKFATEATHEVAFCSVYDGQVWAGEFAHGDKYPTEPAHHLEARDGTRRRGWISGYDAREGFEHPERVLSIPDRTQGMVATDDYIYLSVSYGRRNRSSIEVYRNPLAEPPHRTVKTTRGQDVSLWFLDNINHLRSIDLPPMSQNLIVIDGRLAVLFESGAGKFRFFGKNPLDYIVLLPLEETR